MDVRKSLSGRFTVQIDPDLHARLKRGVYKAGITMTKVITDAAEAFLGNPPPPVPVADENVVSYRDDRERELLSAALDCWRKQPRRRDDLLEALNLLRNAKKRDDALTHLNFALGAWKDGKGSGASKEALTGETVA